MSEIKVIEMELIPPVDQKLSQSIGSLLHGFIMGLIAPAYAEKMHEEGLRPFTQYVFYDKKKERLIWRVAALTELAVEGIIKPLENLPRAVELRQKNMLLERGNCTTCYEGFYQKIMDDFFCTSKLHSSVTLRFRTSASFKRDGGYALYPELSSILRSILQKWNAFTTAETIEATDMVQVLGNEAFIAGYELSMHPFALEHTRVTAFRGTLKIFFKRNQMMRRILGLLFFYSQFCGIGIKTALGMGGVAVDLHEESA
ncbi:CRISPR system precrRNA processing endoribonuclease RAMP protein Cas6 [Colibacter massiliensis]|uniref:CRISPR system precrRNA processing endoribonuclease RAMP protein Cas6 n=1 Tax=Colibacter massiliensis TaxID=1852379 RepID=UPI00266BB1D0|nr:CRISPR system precrRNA processing endoribonuclease RAMP protein Cas6 [Colibacter massiliensis]